MRMTVSFQRRAGNCIWARSYTSESEQSKGNWPGFLKKKAEQRMRKMSGFRGKKG